MKILGFLLVVLLLSPVPARAARHKTAAVRLAATPGCFVAANPQTGEVLGESNPTTPYFDSSGIPFVKSWVDIEISESNYQPGYSLHAAAYASPGNLDCVLLGGTPGEVRWRNLSVGYGPHVDGTGTHADYDDTDIWFGGSWVHYTNAQRDVVLSNQGYFLTIFATDGSAAVTVTAPGGDTYKVVGVVP